MSCNLENKSNHLPIIKLKFGNLEVPALLDTGANLSLVQPSILEEIKQQSKVEHISRMVKIKTLNNTDIPYLSAVNIKFKIKTRWFNNVFFVTQSNWDCNYKIILGYDFIQRNKILIDTFNKRLSIDKTYFEFEENAPQSKQDSDENNQQNQCNLIAKVVNNVTIKPNSFEIVKLEVPKLFHNHEKVILTPIKSSNEKHIESSLHIIENNKYILTIVENKSNVTSYLRKGQKLGIVEIFETDEEIKPTEKEIFQVNSLSLEEVCKLRQAELSESDFDLKHLDEKDRKEILEILMKNYKVFSKNYNTLGSTDAVKPEFKLMHNFPIQTKPYPIPKIAKQFAQEEIKRLLDAGLIENSSSSYNFPVIFVKKKPIPGTSPEKLSFRMVVDYRLLNSITESFTICLPKISEILHSIAGKKYYCVLDLKSAFFQIKLQEKDKEKLAFCCEIGNFQPTVLPFGSRNSTSYFHTLISKCLSSLKGPNLQYFLDDIIVAGDSISEIKAWLQKVFDKLIQFNLTLDPAKLQICQEEITYLGFTVNANGFSPSEDNVNKVSKFPVPKNAKQVQQYIGCLNYFRHMVYRYAEIAKPIINLTRKNVPFVWTSECQEAFDILQDSILNKPTLKNINSNLPFYLVTDASETGFCGILMQKHNEKFFPVEFYSKQFNPAQSRYPSIQRELYAIFASVKHFHEELYGRHFTVLTDAKPLTYHMKLDKQREIVARWLLYLDQFDFSIQHIPGFINPADFLSRVHNTETLNVNNINMFQSNHKLDHDNIVKNQLNDELIKEIIHKLNNKDEETVKNYFIDPITKIVMIKIFPKKMSKNKFISRILVPKSLIKDCLEVAHAPHFGTQKTYNFVRKTYSWKGMFTDTKNFCENCEKCLKAKPKPKNTVTNMIPKADLKPGEFIALDIVGKLPRSHDNKFFILTIVDHYSRYLEAIPLANTYSTTIIKELNAYFSKFGISKVVLTDNGPSFRSDEFRDYLKNLNIQHRKSSIYYPQSNGLLERIHLSMKNSITSLSEQVFEWSDRLLFFKLHYNASKHAVTQYSPAELFFGREINIPLNMFEKPKEGEEYSNYLKKLKNHFQETRKLVKENEMKYFNCHQQYVKGRTKPSLNTGDEVFLVDFHNHTALKQRYNGPYVIEKKLRNDNYLIKINENGHEIIKKVHVSKIFLKVPLNNNLNNNLNESNQNE